MQFIDLKTQYQKIRSQLQQRMEAVFEHGKFILGPEVQELEQKLAQYVGSKHCIGISSGTDALLIAMMALGIGQGDEVITTPFSFIATMTMIKMLGARPVYVDIDPRTYNIDVNQIESAITPRTKAILPVNLYGQCANFDVMNAIASKHQLFVIEDAAQSFGATFKGKRSGNLGTIGCTSFYPAKPLGGYGDAGACFTDDDELAIKIRQISNHGQDRTYHHVILGINGRLDTIQAAILLSKLDIFPDELIARKKIAGWYDQLLSEHVSTPFIEPHNESSYAQYTIQVKHRESIIKSLNDQGIPTAVHYPVPIHEQPVSSNFEHDVCHELPNAENAAKQVLSLPFHPYLTQADVEKIGKAVIQQLTQ